MQFAEHIQADGIAQFHIDDDQIGQGLFTQCGGDFTAAGCATDVESALHQAARCRQRLRLVAIDEQNDMFVATARRDWFARTVEDADLVTGFQFACAGNRALGLLPLLQRRFFRALAEKALEVVNCGFGGDGRCRQDFNITFVDQRLQCCADVAGAGEPVAQIVGCGLFTDRGQQSFDTRFQCTRFCRDFGAAFGGGAIAIFFGYGDSLLFQHSGNMVCNGQ